MVMNADVNNNDNQEIIDDLTPVDTSEDLLNDTEDDSPVDTVVSDTTVDTGSLADTTTNILTESPPESPPAPPPPPIDQQSLEELQRLKAANAEKEWRDQLGRQARAYEQDLQNRGYLPDQARDQARRYIQGQQQVRQQRQEAAEIVGFLEG